MGMHMDVIYNHGYYYILLIAILHMWFLKMVRSSFCKNTIFRYGLFVIAVYLIFMISSAIFFAVLCQQYSDFDGVINDIIRISIDAIIFGFSIVIFSPFTYFIALIHLLITRKFTKCDQPQECN